MLRATRAGSGFGTPVGGASAAGDPRRVPSATGAGPWSGTRVRGNLRTMGVLWICFGVYRLVAGVVALLLVRGALRGDGFGHGFPFAPAFSLPHIPWLAEFFPVLVLGLVMSSALAIVTGAALLKRASWARVLAIIAAVLALIKFPLGTALGVYTMYVLAPRVSATEWDEIATGDR